jgi:hypothetical protein
MNSTITFADAGLFAIAVTALEMDATPFYTADNDTLTINTEDIDGVVDILHSNGIFNFVCYRADADNEHDQFRSDAEADADALASAGFGTDEDYGYYGGDDE